MAATVPLDTVPTYQYSCTQCGEPLEVQQAFSDDPLTTCPSCGGQLRKVYNAVGVVFKGAGFYRTDSRTKSAASESGSKASEPTSKPTEGAAAAAN